jgi:hypothetical protein
MSSDEELARQMNLAARVISHAIVGSEVGFQMVAAEAESFGMRLIVYQEEEDTDHVLR